MAWYTQTLPDRHLLITPDGTELTLKGEAWNTKKKPEYNTSVQTASNQLETRFASSLYNRWYFTLSWDQNDLGYLDKDDCDLLLGLFHQCRGRLRPFVLVDPQDYTIQNQAIGTGDGVTADFQLIRSYGGLGSAAVYCPQGTVSVYVNGGSTAYCTCSSTGLLTFSVIPALNDVITASFHYGWWVRFVQDYLDLDEVVRQLYSAGSVELISLKF